MNLNSTPRMRSISSNMNPWFRGDPRTESGSWRAPVRAQRGRTATTSTSATARPSHPQGGPRPVPGWPATTFGSGAPSTTFRARLAAATSVAASPALSSIHIRTVAPAVPSSANAKLQGPRSRWKVVSDVAYIRARGRPSGKLVVEGSLVGEKHCAAAGFRHNEEARAEAHPLQPPAGDASPSHLERTRHIHLPYPCGPPSCRATQTGSLTSPSRSIRPVSKNSNTLPPHVIAKKQEEGPFPNRDRPFRASCVSWRSRRAKQRGTFG